MACFYPQIAMSFETARVESCQRRCPSRRRNVRSANPFDQYRRIYRARQDLGPVRSVYVGEDDGGIEATFGVLVGRLPRALDLLRSARQDDGFWILRRNRCSGKELRSLRWPTAVQMSSRGQVSAARTKTDFQIMILDRLEDLGARLNGLEQRQRSSKATAVLGQTSCCKPLPHLDLLVESVWLAEARRQLGSGGSRALPGVAKAERGVSSGSSFEEWRAGSSFELAPPRSGLEAFKPSSAQEQYPLLSTKRS